mgnify:CR=1 FL=1
MAGGGSKSIEEEITTWQNLPPRIICEHTSKCGLLDEFSLISSTTVRLAYLLHCHVFMQSSSHKPHEAFCETFFSLCKKVSDPNMCPSIPQALPKLSGNKQPYQFTSQTTMGKCYEIYGANKPGAGGLGGAFEGVVLPEV